MAVTDLERLIVQLEATSTKLDKALSDAASNTDQKLAQVEARTSVFSETMETEFGKAGAYVASFFAFTEITGFINELVETSQALNALSERTGISTDNLQKLGAVGRSVNLTQQQLNDGLDIFARNLAKADTGQGDLAKVMRDYGVTSGQDYVKTLLDLADKVSTASSRTEQYRITTAAFGRTSMELVSFLRQGGAAIQEQMNVFNTGITPETIQSLAAFAVAWRDLSVDFTNFAAGPASVVLRGLTQFIHDLEGGTWEDKLQAMMRLLSLGNVQRPGEDPVTRAQNQIETLTAKIKALDASMAAGFGGPGTNPDIMAGLKAQTEEQIAELTDQLDAAKSVAAGYNPEKPTADPFDNGGKGDPATISKTIASLESQLAQAQSNLVSITDAANAEMLKDQAGYYDAVKQGIIDNTAAAVKAIDVQTTAKIAALDKDKLGEQAYAQAVGLINQTAAVEKKSLFEKQDDDIAKNAVAQYNATAEAAQKLKDIEDARAVALAKTAQDVASSNAAMVKAADDVAVSIATGTAGYYAAVRKQIADDTEAQKAAVLVQEQTEADGLLRLYNERYKAGEDGVTVWADYGTAIVNLQQTTQNKLTTIEQNGAKQREEITEKETQEKATQIQLMDGLRQGLLDLGTDAIDGSKSFGQAIQDMLKNIAVLILQLYVLKPLIKEVLGDTGTTGGGLLGDLGILGSSHYGLSSSSGSSFSSTSLDDAGNFLGFAGGGRPPVGAASIVGEQGPELFIPDSAGTIVPNGGYGSSGTQLAIQVNAAPEFYVTVGQIATSRSQAVTVSYDKNQLPRRLSQFSNDPKARW